MVIVSRKFNREMPVGSMAIDTEFPELGPVHVTRKAHTTMWGTEMGFICDDGQRFEDNAKYYAPFI